MKVTTVINQSKCIDDGYLDISNGFTGGIAPGWDI